MNTISQAAAGPAQAVPKPGAAHRPARERAALGLGRAWAGPGRLPFGFLYLSCIPWIYPGYIVGCYLVYFLSNPITRKKNLWDVLVVFLWECIANTFKYSKIQTK